MKDVLLYITHKIDEKIIQRYEILSKSFCKRGDSFFVFQGMPSERIIDYLGSRNIRYLIIDNDDLNNLGYNPIRETIIPGSNHFILMWFFNHMPGYRYYWNIEYDVVYSGSWDHFFQLNDDRASDFLSCHIKKYQTYPNWYWWEEYYSSDLNIPVSQRVRSFNPIMRISKVALKALHIFLKGNNRGHHEVLIPTFLFHSGFIIEDFGGEGDFVDDAYRNMFYLDDSRAMTMRFRPAIDFDSETIVEGKLYHPIKD